MKIAIEGCAHGELERIYNTIEGIEKEQKIKIDLLLCCGDFQSTRNLKDLQTMAVPKKYLDICTFYKYYSGELVAPVLTIFIGGNHEASNYLQELPYGGWVAPNIYYLGYAGVVQVNGIRIAGISGIYKGHDFLRGHHEFPPYTESTCRSVYHVRQLEVFRLKQLSGKVDIFMSHDWPTGIYEYGNKEQLLKRKPFFAEDMETGKLGSVPLEELLKAVRPEYWFAAHLHCKFAALVPHQPKEATCSSSSSSESDDDDDVRDVPSTPSRPVATTKFLALDKCLPRRGFLQVLDLPSSHIDGKPRLEYDPEWLSILLTTNHLISVKENYYYLPGKKAGELTERFNFTPTPDELAIIHEKFSSLKVPENFQITSKAYDPLEQSNYKQMHIEQPTPQLNPQSNEFCALLGIDDPLCLALLANGKQLPSMEFEKEESKDQPMSEVMSEEETKGDSIVTPSKRKLNLNLPAPTAAENNGREEADASDIDNIDIDKNVIDLPDETVEDDNVQDFLDTSCQEQQALTAATALGSPKQFKRRNQSIYQNEDND